MLKRTLFILLLCWAGLSGLLAQVHPYYESIDIQADPAALKSQLQTLLIQSHVNDISYTPEVWNALKIADLEFEGSNQVLLIYGFSDSDGNPSTDRIRHTDSSCHVSSCSGLWVREHVYPRSLGTPNLGTVGAGSDLHALHAIDNHRNNLRGNRPFGFGSGSSAVVSGGAFYPGDEWKGDVARMMMYMHLRYPQQCPAERVGVGGATYSTIDEMPDIFLIWNAQDPPSVHEQTRNELFFELQGNRNPFIDNPSLATRIWGGPEALDTWVTTSTRSDVPTSEYGIYPSISSEFVYIKAPESPKSEYYIFDIQAKPVVVGRQDSNQIDVRNLQSGVYFLCLTFSSKPMVFRFIKH